MRTSSNPHKDKEIEVIDYWHQVIIPVFIPHLKGYFQDALRILEKCLNSAYNTSHKNTFITVVDNGSCYEVRKFLNSLNQKGEVHELITTSNIGKLNAINKGIIGHNFSFITISDADVLFLPNWQEETMKVYKNFPKCGTVGLVPQFNMFSNFCTNAIFDNFFDKNMRFYPLEQPLEMWKFYRSLGWNIPKDHYYFNYILGLENKNGFKACIGAGHFVATYRKEILGSIEKHIPVKMGKESEKVLDKAAMEAGMWKMTTFQNYAYHMGNSWENWMKEPGEVRETGFIENPGSLKIKVREKGELSYLIKNKVFKKFLRISTVNRWFLKKIKLSPEDLNKYPKIYY